MKSNVDRKKTRIIRKFQIPINNTKYNIFFKNILKMSMSLENNNIRKYRKKFQVSTVNIFRIPLKKLKLFRFCLCIKKK